MKAYNFTRISYSHY